MLLCKELILFRDQPPKHGGSPIATLTVVNSSSVVSMSVCPSGFSSSYDAWSLLFCLFPFLSLCHALSSRIKHNTLSRGQLLHLRLLSVARPGFPVPPVVEGWHSGDSLYYPIQLVDSKDRATWELLWGFGHSSSFLPSCPSLSLNNLLYREDFPRSTHGVGMTWVHEG